MACSNCGYEKIQLGTPGNKFCSDRCYHEWQRNHPGQKATPCFIATSVYGNYDHPIVLDLREFRDNWLVKREKGRNFIRWYYHKGPTLASWIEKSKTIKFLALFLIVKPLHFFVKLFRLHKR